MYSSKGLLSVILVISVDCVHGFVSQNSLPLAANHDWLVKRSLLASGSSGSTGLFNSSTAILPTGGSSSNLGSNLGTGSLTHIGSTSLGTSPPTSASSHLSHTSSHSSASSVGTGSLTQPTSTRLSPTSKSLSSDGSLVTTIETTTNSLGQTFTEVFAETTYSGFGSLTAPTTISTSTLGTVIPVVIGASGRGWAIPLRSNSPVPPPLNLPSNAQSFSSLPSSTSAASTKLSTGSATGTTALGGSSKSSAPISSSSGASDVPLTTFSIFPTESVIAITTGSTTYSNGGHNGLIPILPPHCWFCPPGPPGNLGWSLGGFSVPGIYPAGGPPAGFPTPFPEITVDPSHDPSFSSEPPKSEPTGSEATKTTAKSTSASQSCTNTQTAPECTFDVKIWVPSGQTTSTTSTITQCSTITACSAVGSTTIETITGTSSLATNTPNNSNFQYEVTAYDDLADLQSMASLILADQSSSEAEETDTSLPTSASQNSGTITSSVASSSRIPSSAASTSATIPGQGGVPGCAYVIASDLGTGALCAADYCNCGGTVAPLLTSTVSGSASLGCAYSTQPASATCPPAPSTSKQATTAPLPTTTAAPLPTTTTAAAPPPTTTAPDLSSAVCQACESDLGASNCSATDQQCLIDQCNSDTNCQTCKIDCSTVGFSQ